MMRASNQFAEATTGVVYVHASPAAVCPHVEWALSSTLSARANLKWTPQPALAGQLRAVTNWIGPVGTGAALANAPRARACECPALVVRAAVRGHRGSKRGSGRPPLVPHPTARVVERRDERQRVRDGGGAALARPDLCRHRHPSPRT